MKLARRMIEKSRSKERVRVALEVIDKGFEKTYGEARISSIIDQHEEFYSIYSLNLSAGGKVLLNQTELIVVVLVSLLTFISLVVCFIYRVVQRKRGYNWVKFQQEIDDPTTPLPVGIKLST